MLQSHISVDRSINRAYLNNMTLEIDAIGLLCPLPVLRLRKRLQPLASGERIRLLADDPAAVIDVPHFCNESGHILIDTQDNNGVLVFEVEKSG